MLTLMTTPTHPALSMSRPYLDRIIVIRVFARFAAKAPRNPNQISHRASEHGVPTLFKSGANGVQNAP